jgi:hypothetical protein
LRAWRISARNCWVSVARADVDPLAGGIVIGNQAVAPLLGLVQ